MHPADRLLPGQDRLADQARRRRSSSGSTARCRRRLDDLVTLPGVGRKTANVVLGNAFGVPGITVDTHFGRLVRRFGWTDETDPVKVEHAVGALFPKRDWTMLSHLLIFHGRRTCHARSPPAAPARSPGWCPSYGEGETDPVKAAKLLKYELAAGRPHAVTRRTPGGADRPAPAPGVDRGALLDGLGRDRRRGFFSRFLPPDEGGRALGRADALRAATGRRRGRRAHRAVADTCARTPGQVAFPGGPARPATPGPVAAALREAREEVGPRRRRASRSSAELPALYLPPERLRRDPGAGLVARRRRRSASSTRPRSRGCVRVPLADLLDPANRFTVTHPSGYVGPGVRGRRPVRLGLHRRAARQGARARPGWTGRGTRPTGVRCPSGCQLAGRRRASPRTDGSGP